MDIFSTGVLRRVVASLDEPLAFLLNLFFREVQTGDTEDIHFDVDTTKQRITPFVHPMVAGKVVQSKGWATKTFRPAYAKDKRSFKPDAPMKRWIGEQIGGSLSPQARRDLALRRELMDQLEMLTRREEVMASEALRTGKVTVTGEGYDTVVVDFTRSSALTVALTSGAQWSETTATVIDDLETWGDLIQQTSGAVGMDVVMDPLAWRLFRGKDEVKALLDNRRGSASTAEIGPRSGRKARYGGNIGDYDIWIYQDRYIDDAGVEQKMLPDNTVIVSGAQLEGVRAYGAIQDEKAGYTATRFFSKSWLEEDPAVRWLLMQSAPLVVPYRVNASLCATVVAP
jgi:hypothetical protein